MTPPTFNQILAQLLLQGWPWAIAVLEARDRAHIAQEAAK